MPGTPLRETGGGNTCSIEHAAPLRATETPREENLSLRQMLTYAPGDMKNVHTVIGRSYVVTTSVPCTISTPGGVMITTCEPGEQTSFVSPTKGIVVSDDEARVIESSRNTAAAAAAAGGSLKTYLEGKIAEVARAADEALLARSQLGQQMAPLQEHAENQALHLSAAEREHLESLLRAEQIERGEALPEGALSHTDIRQHLLRNAWGGRQHPAPAVYVTRVPLAWWDEASAAWVNTQCAVNETVFGCPRMFMDNAGRAETPGRNTGPFYRQQGNGLQSDDGTQHISAIKGTPGFSPSGNTVTFGPAFYFFCCPERFYNPTTGQWSTHDGSQDGSPLFQLWGISTCAWHELDESRREELSAHGVSESDVHLWPECCPAESAPRPYWCRRTDEHTPCAQGMELLFAIVQNGSKPQEAPLGVQLESNGALNTSTLADSSASSQAAPVLTHPYGNYLHVTLSLSGEEKHEFWEEAEALDVSDLHAHPERYLHYVPLATRRVAKEQAELMLEKLRNGCPVVPVASYREGARVCNRAADRATLLSGLALGGLSCYELADGELVNLNTDELRAIILDLTTAETLWQQALHQCCAAIDNATDEREIATALADFATLLSGYAVEPLIHAMNTNNNTSWLASLLTGWGIRESWAKIIAGSIAGALAAAGFLSSCTPQQQEPMSAALVPIARVESPL